MGMVVNMGYKERSVVVVGNMTLKLVVVNLGRWPPSGKLMTIVGGLFVGSSVAIDKHHEHVERSGATTCITNHMTRMRRSRVK